MKKRILGVVALIVLISILLFFLSRDSKKSLVNRAPIRNVNSRYCQIELIAKVKGFRIDVSDSVVFILGGEVVYRHPLYAPEKKTVIPQKAIYNIRLNRDTLEYFETDGNTLAKEINGKTVETLPLKNIDRNVLLLKEGFYVADFAKGKQTDDYIIRCLNSTFTFTLAKQLTAL